MRWWLEQCLLLSSDQSEQSHAPSVPPIPVPAWPRSTLAIHPRVPWLRTPGALPLSLMVVSLDRDGRVSENTVCLIRKLLVLDPQQRLTASEVLESLSSIIASW